MGWKSKEVLQHKSQSGSHVLVNQQFPNQRTVYKHLTNSTQLQLQSYMFTVLTGRLFYINSIKQGKVTDESKFNDIESTTPYSVGHLLRTRSTHLCVLLTVLELSLQARLKSTLLIKIQKFIWKCNSEFQSMYYSSRVPEFSFSTHLR